MLYLDLDGFKAVNDSLGHDEGDAVLAHVGRAMVSALGPHDLVARLAGDEFAALLLGRGGLDQVTEAARDVLEALPGATASVGVATAGQVRDGRTPVEAAARLLRAADLAMLEAKRRGGGCVARFEPAMMRRADAKAASFRRATSMVDTAELTLGFQPVVALPAAEVVRVEALLRVPTPSGAGHPAEVLDVAARTGRMPALTRWVLREAITAACTWWPAHAVPVSVNVPAAAMGSPAAVPDITAVLRDAHLPPEALVVEVHRGAHALPASDVRAILQRLADVGIGVVLEDVDTAWSMADLTALAPTEASVGRFCLLGDEAAHSAARAVVEVARASGAVVTAKNVETQAELARALELGCARAQGLLLGPVSRLDPEHPVARGRDWAALVRIRQGG